MNKIFSLILILVLASGFVSAFTLIDLKHTFKTNNNNTENTYFVTLNGAPVVKKYSEGMFTTSEYGAKYETKSNVLIHLSKPAFPCVDLSTTYYKGFENNNKKSTTEQVASEFDIYGVKGGAKYNLPLLVGQKVEFEKKWEAGKIIIELQKFELPFYKSLTLLPEDNDPINVYVCDYAEFEVINFKKIMNLPVSSFTVDLNSYLNDKSLYNNKFMWQDWDKTVFYKPTKVQVVLKITELN